MAFLVILCASYPARAGYFPKKEFESYRSDGRYPFWSATWLPLDPRLHFDPQGIPIIKYGAVSAYNPVTIAVFGLLAYNRLIASQNESDRADFLKVAHWLRDHQNLSCGCWYYDFDFNYVSLDETIPKPWVSGMAQGLAISVMTRAYSLTRDALDLRTAQRALIPFRRDVKSGGIARHFSLVANPAVDSDLVFFEEYPTEPAASFTLNGFMFSLIGLYDLAQTGNSGATDLFREGNRTLHECLPFFDLGNGTAYDLGHLTLPPRAVHSDSGYHLIHITLLNALGTATNDRTLLWYRDRWNSYGSAIETQGIWFARVGYWIKVRHPVLGAVTLSIIFLLVFLAVLMLNRLRLPWRGWPEKMKLRPSVSSPLPRFHGL